MNTNEGTHRIRLLGKGIMLFGSLAAIALWIGLSVLHREGSVEGRPGLGELYILMALPVTCGAILWVIGWIVEGFMTPSRHD